MDNNNLIFMKNAEITFTPSEPLIKFAEAFSKRFKDKNFKTDKGETFSSIDNNYIIKYYDLLTERKEPSITFARISNLTGTIELNRRLLINNENIKEDFIFFLIIWCAISKYVSITEKCDEITLQYYITTKRSPKDVLIGLLEQSKTETSPLFKERFLKIKAFFNKIYGFLNNTSE